MDPHTPEQAASQVRSDSTIHIRAPFIEDGADLWRIARDSETLDLNSSYAYVLWAKDFADTSRIALVDGAPAGFVIGYRPPSRPDCLFIWQIAVDEHYRGLGLGGRMLSHLVEELTDPRITVMHTTITDDNIASQHLFRGFARRWGGAPVHVEPLFEEHHFVPTDASTDEHHDPERLYRIGPPRTD